MFIGYTKESKGFNLLNIKTKQIFIERSVRFDEPLQEVELVEENSVDFPSCSANNLGDKSGSDDSDFVEMISNISEKEISHSESDSEVQTNLPTWAKNTLSSAGENIGNPANRRRTRYEFQRAGIALSCYDYLLYETYYLMIGSDPNSYYHSKKYPRWKASMDKEFNSLQKNATWELVSLPPGRKLVQ